MYHHFPPLASSHFLEEGLGTALGTHWCTLGAGHGRTSAPGRAALSLCPLTLGWWPHHLPAARGSVSCLCLRGRRGHHLLGSPSPFRSQSRSFDRALCIWCACKWLSGKIRKGMVDACCVLSWQGSVCWATVCGWERAAENSIYSYTPCSGTPTSV